MTFPPPWPYSQNWREGNERSYFEAGSPAGKHPGDGRGAYRPSVIVTNEDVCQWIDSSDEWIRQRTGIITRHRAPADVSVIDMAEGAAREALQKAGIDASELGAVIVSTVTHPYATPSAAASLADRLGATPAPAFDISAACAGYCYGIAQADALVRSGAAKYVLVVGAEKLSDVIDNTERTISFLLGDGAGAVVIGPPTPRASARRSGARTAASGTPSA